MTAITCPHCGRVFEVDDPHRPLRCPHCHALLSFTPVGVRVLMGVEEMLGRAGGVKSE